MRFDSAEFSSDQHLPLQFTTGILNSFLTMFQHVFIFSSGKSKEAEIKRINKELANIRNKFKGKFVRIICELKCILSNFIPPIAKSSHLRLLKLTLRFTALNVSSFT